MLANAFNCLFMTFSLCGWGYGLRSLLLKKLKSITQDFSADIIFGLYSFLFFGQIIPLIMPNPASTGIVILYSGNIIFLYAAKKNYDNKIWTVITFINMIFSVIGFELFSHAYISYDSGLYHLSFIKWIAESGTSLGLVNIHSRFGFNSSWLSTASLFSKGTSWYSGAFLWSAIATTAICAAIFNKAILAWHLSHKLCLRFCVFSLAILFILVELNIFFTFTQTDLPATLIVLYALATAVSSLESQAAADERYVIIALTIAIAITIKLSVAPILILVFIIAYTCIDQNFTRQFILPILIILITLPLVWCIQNLALTGCMLYPVKITCVDFPWTADSQTILNEINWIKSWARIPKISPEDPIFIDYRWVSKWATVNFGVLLVWSVITITGIILFCAGLYFKDARTSLKPLVLPIVVSLFGVIFWFLNAPDTRFGMGFIVGLAALIVSAGVSLWPKPVMLIVIFLLFSYKVPKITSELTLINEIEDYSELIPIPLVVSKKTKSDLVVNIPTQGEQCWLAELPCTPYLDPNLRMSNIGNYKIYLKK